MIFSKRKFPQYPDLNDRQFSEFHKNISLIISFDVSVARGQEHFLAEGDHINGQRGSSEKKREVKM